MSSFTDIDLQLAQNFFHQTHSIDPKYVKFDNWNEKNDAILVEGEYGIDYAITKCERNLYHVYGVKNYYSWRDGHQQVENLIKEDVNFNVALNEVAEQLMKDEISYVFQSIQGEPDWDGVCRCGSDEDNPCVCN